MLRRARAAWHRGHHASSDVETTKGPDQKPLAPPLAHGERAGTPRPLEAGWHDLCNAVVFIDTPEPIRRNRVLASRRWTAEQFRQREESQMPLDQKRRAGDFVIDNSGSLSDAVAELGRVVDQVRERTSGTHDNFD